MTIRLWKGYHSPELQPLIASSWDDGILLILCPPLLKDFSFFTALPPGRLEFFGSWSNEERGTLKSMRRFGLGGVSEAPALGVFTSGTLSPSPRLVLYSRKNVLASLSGIFALFERSRIQHLFCYPQAFHTFGLTLGYLASHVMGWQLHAPEGKYQRNAHAKRLNLSEESVLTLGTPTHFYDLLQFLRAAGTTLTPSYSCIMGGASVSRDLWLQVRDELKIAAPSIGYGCTEAAPGITHLPPGQVPIEDGEIGYPLASLRAQILADEGVEISGAALCLAVIQNREISYPATLRIRDRLLVGERGVWLYRGRLDLLMNRGGAKYSLEAIEKTLHEQLGMVAVACSVRDTRLGEDLGLAILAPQGEGRTAMIESARGVLKDVYALRLSLEHTRFVSDFPLNECSKLDRKSIWTLFADQSTLPQ